MEDGIEEVISREYESRLNEIVTIDFVVFEVQPQNANKVIKTLNSQIPLTMFPHLKRIKKRKLEDGVLLTVLFYPVDEEASILGVEPLLELIDTNSRDIVPVPRYPPLTTEQVSAMNELWPVSFFPNSVHVVRPISDQFNSIDLDYILSTMRQVVNFASNDKTNLFVAAIADPRTKTILSMEKSNSAHPLGHACMESIHQIGITRSTSNPIVIHDISAIISASNLSHGDTIVKKRKVNKSALSEDSKEYDAGDKQEMIQSEYLCSGLDSFLIYEPCVMCAMALLHSRISRVFYIFPNKKCGALGTHYRLHCEHALNHSFKVYRHILLDESRAILEI